jgi:hypothetical protein
MPDRFKTTHQGANAAAYAVTGSAWRPLDGTRPNASRYDVQAPREWLRFEIVYTPKTSS